MRLVAWNANHVNRPRSFDDNVTLLEPLHGDILVISETGIPTDPVSASVSVVGQTSPALGVSIGPDFHLDAYPENETAPGLMGAWKVSGRVAFKLLAAWPVKRPSLSFHRLLMDGLHHFREFLADGPVVIAGDLNTSSRVQDQERAHGVFVDAARQLGLVSVYHTQSGEEHGSETHNTYRHGSIAAKPFHLDYCFVSAGLAAAATVSVLGSAVWCQRSDHSPIVLDIPDRAF